MRRASKSKLLGSARAVRAYKEWDRSFGRGRQDLASLLRHFRRSNPGTRETFGSLNRRVERLKKAGFEVRWRVLVLPHGVSFPVRGFRGGGKGAVAIGVGHPELGGMVMLAPTTEGMGAVHKTIARLVQLLRQRK